MSAALQIRAERLKLARVLGLDDGDLPAMHGVGPDELRVLRGLVTERLHEDSSAGLGAIAAASGLVPTAISATIAEKAFGPLLCARVASAVEPGKAVDIARRLPAPFLAEVAVHLEPRRAAAIVAKVPDSLVVAVTRELARRKEYVTMGRFLGVVPDAALTGSMGVLDAEALLRTAFVLEHKEALDHAVALLPADRMPAVLVAAADLDLWAEALDLLDHLSPARRGPIADLLADLDESVVVGLVRAATEGDLWVHLLPIVRVMGDDARVRLAARAPFHDRTTLEAMVRAAVDAELWSDLVPLIAALPDDVQVFVRGVVAEVARTADPELVAQMRRELPELGL